jgi:hypothetical protein
MLLMMMMNKETRSHTQGKRRRGKKLWFSDQVFVCAVVKSYMLGSVFGSNKLGSIALNYTLLGVN